MLSSSQVAVFPVSVPVSAIIEPQVPVPPLCSRGSVSIIWKWSHRIFQSAHLNCRGKRDLPVQVIDCMKVPYSKRARTDNERGVGGVDLPPGHPDGVLPSGSIST